MSLALVACGKSTATTPAPSFNSYAAAEPGDLPACDATRVGQLFYVSSTKNFETCDGTQWIVIDVTGKPGQDGMNGADGMNGMDGMDGKDGGSFTLVSKMSCAKLATYVFRYHTALFSNGMRFVECEVGTDAQTLSSSFLFDASEMEATIGRCNVGFDIDSPSGGLWQFAMSPRLAGYIDSGSTSNGQHVVFEDADCTF